MKALQTGWLALAIVLGSGCNGIGNWHHPVVKGSGTVVTEERALEGFQRVSVAGAGHLTIIQGEAESLSITTDDNLLPYIKSEVRGDELRIYPDDVSPRPTEGLNYVLRLKDLRSLNLSGSLTAEAESLKADSLRVGISGSGSITIPDLTAEETELHVSGSGDGRFAGEADRQVLRISGSGKYEAADLRSREADLHISGSGNATVWVSERLEAHISGSGSVNYYGNPLTDQHVSGSGKIRALGAK